VAELTVDDQRACELPQRTSALREPRAARLREQTLTGFSSTPELGAVCESERNDFISAIASRMFDQTSRS